MDSLRGYRRTRSLQAGAWIFVAWAVLTGLMIWVPAAWLVPYAFTTAQVLAPAVVALFAVAAWLPWAVVASSSLAGVLVLRWMGRAIPSAIDRQPAAIVKVS